MFQRKIYNRLLEWKREKQGSTAILIEGARRVGKSTIAEAFAQNEYKSYILIDFSMVSDEVIRLFDNLSDLNYLFLQLQLQFQTDLYERESLIIFDEVQFCPRARQAVKVLVRDRRYDYLETGSLISIRKNVKDILIPSEEERIAMYPMDYEEFRWALSDKTTIPLLQEAYNKKRRLGDDMNRRLLRDFRLYMLVGGMPQAVDTYIESNNFRKVDNKKREILKLYDEDFMKIDPTGRASLLFRAIPAQLNANASRYQVSGVLRNERAESILPILSEMESSKTVLVSYHANSPDVGLSASLDLERFKLFVCDTGLFTTLMFADREFTENVIYEKLLSDKLGTNLGYLYENIVAQTLTANGENLFYHVFSNEVSKHNYEIDFLLARKNKICPLEIKSSGYRTHKSMDRFSEKYSGRILSKYLIYTKDMRKEEDIIYLPVYMTLFL